MHVIKGRVLYTYPKYVPRPLEKWIKAFVDEKEWRNSDENLPWLKRLRDIAASYDCDIVFDVRWHWKESIYLVNYLEGGVAVLSGGRGRASSLARKYTLPFSAKIRCQGLYSYKWAQIQQ